MNFLKTKLSPVIDNNTLDQHIKYYLYSQILVRSGGLINNDVTQSYFNPFLEVEKDSKVVVYSSGSFGQHILSTNLKTDFFKIINWVDVDFHDLEIGGNSVQPISAVSNDEFDYLIIATINPSVHKLIENELGLMGIDKNKIVKIDTNEARIDKLINDLGFDNEFIFQNN